MDFADYDLTRREFLEISVAAGLVALADTRIERSLTTEQRRTLVAVVRTVFPHDGVGEGPYLRAVARIEQCCRDDAAVFHDIAHEIASLEAACGGRFTEMLDRRRIDLIKAKQGTHFYRLVYREALEGLYGSADLWSMFVAPRRI